MSRARDIADGTLNSADINGGNIDNTTIGGTTPAAGTFTTFTSTGIDDNASSTALTIDSSGNIGVGTSSPSTGLHLNGSVATTYNSATVGGQDTAATLLLQNTNAAADTFASIDFNTNNDRVVNRIVSSHGSTTTSGYLAFITEGSGVPAERMRIDSSGNVGIGTTNPTSISSTATTLDVVGDSSGHVRVERTNATNPSIGSIKALNSEIRIAAETNSVLTLHTNNTESLRIDYSKNLKFDSGYGSVETAYGCRAWVNFNGTGTVSIGASGNVSSITDNGTGYYTVNFTTAMPDANFSVLHWGMFEGTLNTNGAIPGGRIPATTLSTTYTKVYYVTSTTAAAIDVNYACVAVFR